MHFMRPMQQLLRSSFDRTMCSSCTTVRLRASALNPCGPAVLQGPCHSSAAAVAASSSHCWPPMLATAATGGSNSSSWAVAAMPQPAVSNRWQECRHATSCTCSSTKYSSSSNSSGPGRLSSAENGNIGSSSSSNSGSNGRAGSRRPEIAPVRGSGSASSSSSNIASCYSSSVGPGRPHSLSQVIASSCSSSSPTDDSSYSTNDKRTSSSNIGGIMPPPVDKISSTANAYIKHCVRLRESSRYRQQQRRLLLVGSTLLAELADGTSNLQVLILFRRPDATMPPGINAQQVITVTDPVMKKLTGLEEPAAVQLVAELALPDYVSLASCQALHSQQQQHSSIPASTPQQQQSQLQKQSGDATDEATAVVQLQRLLVLEGVQDPGNLGTLLRCAAAFGWGAVWLLPGCCDPFNDKALRASRGAVLRVPLAAGSLSELLGVVKQHAMLLLAAEPEEPAAAAALQQQQDAQQLQQKKKQQESGQATYAVLAGSEDLVQAPLALLESIQPLAEPSVPSSRKNNSSSSSGKMTGIPQAYSISQPVCLVLGTEGAGLSDAVLQAGTPIAIPMSGRMESLNVGVAGSILMFALSDGLPQLLTQLQQLQQ